MARPRNASGGKALATTPAAGSRAWIAIERTQGATKRAVIKGLRAYNRARTGRKEYAAITLSLRDESGDIVGGLLAEVYWDWMFIKLLWIRDDHRGAGSGEALLRTAEDEARKHGAKNAFLDTLSFQAPDFYAKFGYHEFGRLEDHPLGHQRFWLKKAL